VGLDWNVKDPSFVEGTAEEIRAAYEETFQYINTHIRDLVEAILGEQQTEKEKHALTTHQSEPVWRCVQSPP